MKEPVTVTQSVSSYIWQWNDFENQSAFAEVMVNSQVYCFLTHTVVGGAIQMFQ